MSHMPHRNGSYLQAAPALAGAPPRDRGRGGPANRTRIGFVGDLMLGRRVSSKIGGRPPERFWGNLLPALRDCDGVIGNLESPITTNAEPWSKTWKAFHFRAIPAATDVLKMANVRMVNLANNHIMDFGERGLLDTRVHLARAGIAYAGAGASATEALAPAICRIGDLKVGLIGLTDNMREWAADGAHAGINHMPIRGDHPTRSLIRLSVDAARRQGADCVVLSVHWGPNLRTRPTARFQRFAHNAIEDGVDVVHGHSAHLIQGIEVHRAGVILYDTGDFMSDYWVFPGIRTDRSALFQIEFLDRRPVAVSAVPVSLQPATAGLAKGRESDAICRCLARRSRALGTVPKVSGSQVTISVDEPLQARACT
jgi:poly-gamma-glutamate capsule biosynthesis protein CapA/YwtB (metallophosphatase superfamily)